MRTSGLPLLALLTPACAVDLDALRFACEHDDECARGTVCDPIARICARPDALSPAPDGGLEPDAAVPVDPLAPVRRCFPPIEQRGLAVRARWCTGLSTDDVEALRGAGEDLVDLRFEALGPDGIPAFAATFARSELTPIRWLPHRYARDGYSGVFPEELIWKTAGYEDAFGDLVFAIRLAPRVNTRGSRYWYLGFTPDRASLAPYVTGSRQVIDLSTYRADGALRGSVTLTDRSPPRLSDFAVDVPLDALEATLTASAARAVSLAWNGREGPPAFLLSYETRLPHDPPERVILAADALALEAARAPDELVRLIAPHVLDGERVYTAILSRAPSTVEEEILARVADVSSGTVAFALSTESATRAVGLELAHIPGRALLPLVVLLASEASEAGRLDERERIPRFGLDASGCPTASSTTTETVGEALDAIVTANDRARAKALLDRLGRTELDARADALGVTIGGALECGSDTASSWTLAASARLWRQLSAHPAAWPRLLGGAVDPRGLGPKLRDLAARELEGRALSPAARARFLDGLRLVYGSASRSSPRGELMAGLLSIPRCDGTSALPIAALVDGAASSWRAGVGVERAWVVLAREATRAAIDELERCP